MYDYRLLCFSHICFVYLDIINCHLEEPIFLIYTGLTYCAGSGFNLFSTELCSFWDISGSIECLDMTNHCFRRPDVWPHICGHYCFWYVFWFLLGASLRGVTFQLLGCAFNEIFMLSLLLTKIQALSVYCWCFTFLWELCLRWDRSSLLRVVWVSPGAMIGHARSFQRVNSWQTDSTWTNSKSFTWRDLIS